MNNESNLNNQNIQAETNKPNTSKHSKLTITFAILLIIVSNTGSYLFMNKLLNQKNNKINELSNQLNTSITKISDLESKIQELSEKANKEQEPKTSSLSIAVDKAEIVNKGGEPSTLFITLTLKNTSSNNYEFKASNLKVKNNSENVLGVYFAYPEIYGYNTGSPLSDQTISAGESVNGFLQIPLTETKAQPETFNVIFADSTTGVSVTAKAEAKIRNL